MYYSRLPLAAEATRGRASRGNTTHPEERIQLLLYFSDFPGRWSGGGDTHTRPLSCDDLLIAEPVKIYKAFRKGKEYLG